MFEVGTDFKIVAGDHRMQIVGSGDLSVITTATRNPADGVWTVHAENGSVPDVTAPTVTGSATPRSEVITALVNQTLAAVPQDGISVTVPHKLAETP